MTIYRLDEDFNFEWAKRISADPGLNSFAVTPDGSTVMVFSAEPNAEIAKLAVEKEKIAAQKQIADTKLQIAKENKNKYDSPKSEDKK